MKTFIVIPARMASTRFPDKPLAMILGRTMIERVWQVASSVSQADEVLIATDDLRLKAFAEGFGAKVVMTSPDCLTGTDRVAEVAEKIGQKEDIFFSFQGDAVLTPPWVVSAILQEMLADSCVEISTPVTLLTGKARSDFIASKKTGNTSGTCAVFDKKHNALYFSKTLIPYVRDEATPIYRHIGLYAYRAPMLKKLQALPEGSLEKAEKLEQLRALENGINIRVVPVDYQGRTHGSVDRPEDISVVESIIHAEGELV